MFKNGLTTLHDFANPSKMITLSIIKKVDKFYLYVQTSCKLVQQGKARLSMNIRDGQVTLK